MLARLFASQRTSVAVENPTYAGSLDAFATAGVRILPVPVVADVGPRFALRQFLRRERPRLLYLMPTFRNQTGSVASVAQRQ